MSNAQEKRVNRIAELKGFVWKGQDTERATAVSTSWTWLRAGGCGPAFLTTSIPFLWRRPKRGLLGTLNDSPARACRLATTTHDSQSRSVYPAQSACLRKLPFIRSSFFEVGVLDFS